MSRSQATRFPLQVRGGPADAAEWDTLADALRTELLDVGATRVERVSTEQSIGTLPPSTTPSPSPSPTSS